MYGNYSAMSPLSKTESTLKSGLSLISCFYFDTVTYLEGTMNSDHHSCVDKQLSPTLLNCLADCYRVLLFCCRMCRNLVWYRNLFLLERLVSTSTPYRCTAAL